MPPTVSNAEHHGLKTYAILPDGTAALLVQIVDGEAMSATIADSNYEALKIYTETGGQKGAMQCVVVTSPNPATIVNSRHQGLKTFSRLTNGTGALQIILVDADGNPV